MLKKGKGERGKGKGDWGSGILQRRRYANGERGLGIGHRALGMMDIKLFSVVSPHSQTLQTARLYITPHTSRSPFPVRVASPLENPQSPIPDHSFNSK
ncbi:hypothetical protein BLD44_024270 [Mastigocladus laminosus UU774]|nr:hypothetical protein BLD44_024270 [Mastigocladus laminosus UU774]